MVDSVLNPALYRRLEMRYGRVKVTNPGEAMVREYRPQLDGSVDMDVSYAGEYYVICCPECNDTRFRLYINHRWGVLDEVTESRNLWLMHCYNDEGQCFADWRDRGDFYEDISQIEGLFRARVLPGKQPSTAPGGPVQPPGPTRRLDKLPKDHPANVYLANRYYDPDRLGRFYGVSYCLDSIYSHARNRIVMPFYMAGKLVGWQGRYVGELDWKAKGSPPKWFSCPNMKKSQILVNYDNAIKYQTGVIVEGPGDVWGFGPMSMATLGDTMSRQQVELFKLGFGKHSGVMLWDPEALTPNADRKQEALNSLLSQLRDGCGGRFAVVKLPECKDPGSLDRAFMREYVAQEAKAQGVRVSWKLR